VICCFYLSERDGVRCHLVPLVSLTEELCGLHPSIKSMPQHMGRLRLSRAGIRQPELLIPAPVTNTVFIGRCITFLSSLFTRDDTGLICC
jgi:hypothetical protein